MANLVTGIYLLSSVLFLSLLIQCYRVKNGLGLKMIQTSVGSAFFLCFSVSLIRLGCFLKLITPEQVLELTLVPALGMASFGLYLNWLFAKKR